MNIKKKGQMREDKEMIRPAGCVIFRSQCDMKTWDLLVQKFQDSDKRALNQECPSVQLSGLQSHESSFGCWSGATF